MVIIYLTHQPTIWPQNYNIYQRNIQFYQFSIVIRNGSNTIFLLICKYASKEIFALKGLELLFVFLFCLGIYV